MAAADEILFAILELPLERVRDSSLLPDAYHIAQAMRISVYDALFLALARTRQAQLITADTQLKKRFLESSTSREVMDDGP